MKEISFFSKNVLSWQRSLASAERASRPATSEADCLVTGCSMCQANLDTRQEDFLPVFYFTELMGLALGHKNVKK